MDRPVRLEDDTMTARRVGRWALFVGLGVVGVLLALRAGVGVYLHTSSGKAAVAHQLQSFIGMPVEVADVNLGTRTSGVKFRVLDPAGSPGAPLEVLSVESATADVSLAEIVTGRAHPKELHLKGAHLSMRIDAAGKVLTGLPNQQGEPGNGSIPEVTVENGRLTVRQEGHPEFDLSGMNLTAQPDGDKVKLAGTIDDPGWGKWSISGEVDRASKSGWVELVTEDGPLTADRLRSIPFLPPSLADHAKPDGRGAAKVRLAIGTQKDFHFDVTIFPKKATLTVPDADVVLTDLEGSIRLFDAQLELKGCRAKLADGVVTAAGTADFRHEPNTAKLRVTADGLDVHKLPAEWGVPKDFGGKLRGKAEVELAVHPDGRIDPTGSGEGDLVEAKWGTLPVEVKLFLGKEGDRLKLKQSSPGAPKQPGAMRPNPWREGGKAVTLRPDTVDRGPKAADAPSPGGSASPHRRPLPGGRGEDAGVSVSRSKWESSHLSPRGEVAAERSDAAGEGASSPPRTSPPSFARVPAFDPLPLVLLAQPPKTPDPKTDPPAKKDEPTTVEANITLRDIEVGQLLEQLQLKVPYRFAGKVTVTLAVSVPVNSATSRAAYRFSGTLTSPEFRFEDLTVRDLSAHVDYQNGKLTLTALKGSVPQAGDPKAAPGSFSGTATAQMDPPGDVTASLTLDRLPPGEVLRAVPGFALEVRGTVTGKAEFRAPYQTISDPATWSGSADVRSDDLVVAGRSARGVRLVGAVSKGVVTLKDTAATVEGIPVTAAGTLGLTGKMAFDATVKTTGTGITDLRKLIPEADLPIPIEGLLETETHATGTLSPLTYSASGTVRGSKLAISKSAANNVEFRWEVTQERLKLTGLKAELFGGTVTGSADVPFDPKKGGAFDLAFKDFDAAAAAAFVPDFPVKVSGRVTGKVAGTILPEMAGQSRVGALDIDLTAPKLTVQGFPAERLVGKAAVKGGAIEYQLEGKTLGGSFEVKGRYPGASKKGPDTPAGAPGGLVGGAGVPSAVPAAFGWNSPAAEAARDLERVSATIQPPDRGSLRVEGADLARLAPEWGFQSLAPLKGRVDITFDYANDLSSGTGRITIRGLAWGNSPGSPEIVGVMVLRDGFLQLTDLSGTLARGYLRGRARVNVRNPDRNFFLLAIDRADAARLFGPVPELAGVVTGDVSLTVHGRIGRDIRGAGTVTVARGKVGGVDVSELRIPFDYATSAGGYGRVAVREATTHAGTGQARASLTVEWGQGVRLDGQVLFNRVPVRTLVPSLAESSFFGNGRLTGRFDIAGTNVRSVDDLSGTLVASLNQASVREIPILQQITPYLNTVGVTRPFDAGDIRGNLSRGVFRLQRLALANPTSQLFADGTITLAGGRLDLNVVAHTGQIGPDVPGLRVFGLRLPAFGPLPLTLIRDVSNFLSNRTVRLTVTGTASNPVVQVNTAALLTEEAVRFFVGRYIVPAELAELAGFGSVLGTGLGTSTGSNR